MGKPACDIKIRAEGRCRLCLRPWIVRPPTRHRVVGGRYGGHYVPENVVGLCRPCHDLVDHWDMTIRLPARRMLRASLWPAEIAQALARFGWRHQLDADRAALFDQHYPRPTRELVLERRSPTVAEAG